MPNLKEAVEDFLAQRRIAIAGVSRSGKEASNLIYRKLRDAGYEAFAINPNVTEIEGDRCYANLASVPGGVDGVVIATHPRVTEQIVRECAELGISRVWIHRSFGVGSFSEEAVEYCHQHGVSVIPGACPMMYSGPVDFGHKCMRWILGVTGKLPEPSAGSS